MADFSVNTNAAAFVALQSLTQTIRSLEKTQLNITTGLRVNGPKDDASTFAIAQNQRGDIAGFTAVKIALSSGESTVNVAITAGKSISDLMIERKAKVVQSNQAGLDSASRTALHNDFAALRDQITTIVQTAEFNGANLITSGATGLSVLSTVDGSTIIASAQVMDTATLGISATDLTSSASAAGAHHHRQRDHLGLRQARQPWLFGQAHRGSVRFHGQARRHPQGRRRQPGRCQPGEESADLQALQVKQQLGIQALSIANTNPQSILQLFQ